MYVTRFISLGGNRLNLALVMFGAIMALSILLIYSNKKYICSLLRHFLCSYGARIIHLPLIDI